MIPKNSRILDGNDQYILYLLFSPNSLYLVTYPFNKITNIYDIHPKGKSIVDTIFSSSTPGLNKFYNNSDIPLKKSVLPDFSYPLDSLKFEDSHTPSTNNHYENTYISSLSSSLFSTSSTSTSPAPLTTSLQYSHSHKYHSSRFFSKSLVL